jgi:hypothetical protein
MFREEFSKVACFAALHLVGRLIVVSDLHSHAHRELVRLVLLPSLRSKFDSWGKRMRRMREREKKRDEGGGGNESLRPILRTLKLDSIVTLYPNNLASLERFCRGSLQQNFTEAFQKQLSFWVVKLLHGCRSNWIPHARAIIKLCNRSSIVGSVSDLCERNAIAMNEKKRKKEKKKLQGRGTKEKERSL